jgi:hypothetical protein
MQGHGLKLLLVVAAFAAIAGTAAPAAAKKAKSQASPTPVAQPNIVPGYYLMLANQIVSPRYPDLPSCLKDLNDVKHRMVPGSDMMACAHRIQ